MKSPIVAALAALAGTVCVQAANAQSIPADALPPGGLTIAGPGLAVFTNTTLGGKVIWTSAAAKNICVTVGAPTNASTSVATGIAVTVGTASSSTVPPGVQWVTRCGDAVTSASVFSSVATTVFWRVDRSS